MELGDRDIGGRGVEPGHRCAEPRQRLGQDARRRSRHRECVRPSSERRRARIATEAPAGLVADIGEPHRVEPVQDLHGPFRVPPGLGRSARSGRPRRGRWCWALSVMRTSSVGVGRSVRHVGFRALTARHPTVMYTPPPRSAKRQSRFPSGPSVRLLELMPRLVMKFGGTSVATVERIRNVARHVKREVDGRLRRRGRGLGHVRQDERARRLVQGGLRRSTIRREYDAVVASGEQVTSGLLALVLQEMGVPARSWQGWQMPILTSDAHGSARIAGDRRRRHPRGLRGRAEVAVVVRLPGHSRADPANHDARARRLGHQRGGARRRHRGRPLRHLYRRGRRLHHRSAHRPQGAAARQGVAFEEMLEMASLGAKVLQVRSVELAMVHKVPTYVRSSFDDPADPQARHPHLRRGRDHGTAGRHRHRLFQGRGADHPAQCRGQARRRRGDLRAAGRCQHQCRHDHPGRVRRHATTDITFTVPTADYERARDGPRRHSARHRLAKTPGRDRRGQGLGDRRRHAQPCRRRRPGLQGAGREGHQHPRDHDLGDQVLGADRRGLYRACGAHAPLAIRPRSRPDCRRPD